MNFQMKLNTYISSFNRQYSGLILFFVLSLVSCDSDMELQNRATPAETATAVLTVDLQNDLTTKSGTPAPFHLEYGAGNYTHDIRFVLQVLAKSGNDYIPMGTPSIQTAGTSNIYGKGNEANVFTVHYPKNIDYKIAVWVDYVVHNTDGGGSNETYIVSDLTKIQRSAPGSSTDPVEVETCQDAYSAVKFFSAGTAPDNITATRPFAMLRIKATDANVWDELFTFTSSNLSTLRIAFDGVPQFYDMLTGQTSGSTTLYTQKTEFITADNKYSGAIYFSGLVFVPEETGIYNIRMTSSMNYDGGSVTPTPTTLTNIPLQRNYRTNVSGNLYVNYGNFTVEKSTTFNEPDIPWNMNHAVDTNTKQVILEVVTNQLSLSALLATTGTSGIVTTTPYTFFLTGLIETGMANDIASVAAGCCSGTIFDVTGAIAGDGVNFDSVFSGYTPDSSNPYKYTK